MSYSEDELARFKRITDRNTEKLLRESATEFNFTELKDKLINSIEAVKNVESNPEFWNQLPDTVKAEINSKIDNLAAVLDRMEGYVPNQDNSWSERQSIIEVFESEYSQLYLWLIEKLRAYFGLEAYQKDFASKANKQARENLEEASTVLAEIRKAKDDILEANSIAGQVASTNTSKYFDDEASNYMKSESRWLWAIVGFGSFTVVISLIFSLNIIFEFKDLEAFINNPGVITTKLVLLAASLIGLKFTIRNYSASRHLYAVNKHRSNVLKAMEAYRDSAAEPSAKDAVLLSAIGAAFSHVETGLISVKDGAGSGGEDISPELLSIISSLKK